MPPRPLPRATRSGAGHRPAGRCCSLSYSAAREIEPDRPQLVVGHEKLDLDARVLVPLRHEHREHRLGPEIPVLPEPRERPVLVLERAQAREAYDDLLERDALYRPKPRSDEPPLVLTRDTAYVQLLPTAPK